MKKLVETFESLPEGIQAIICIAIVLLIGGLVSWVGLFDLPIADSKLKN